MKKLISLIILIFLLFPQSVFADEDFTIWVSQTFSPPNGSFANNATIAISPDITNPNEYTSFDLVVRYEQFIPDSATATASYNVYAVIEAAYLTGEWTPVHYQFEGINSYDDAPFRMMTMVPYSHMPMTPGNSYEIKRGIVTITKISLMGGKLMDVFRVRLVNSDPTGTSPLTSLRVSAYGRKYDKPFPQPGTP